MPVCPFERECAHTRAPAQTRTHTSCQSVNQCPHEGLDFCPLYPRRHHNTVHWLVQQLYLKLIVTDGGTVHMVPPNTASFSWYRATAEPFLFPFYCVVMDIDRDFQIKCNLKKERIVSVAVASWEGDLLLFPWRMQRCFRISSPTAFKRQTCQKVRC